MQLTLGHHTQALVKRLAGALLMDKSMKISFVNYRKEFPRASKNCYKSWFSIDRYWSGKLIYLSVKHYSLQFDFRSDWVSDITFGKVKMKDCS